MIKTIKVYICDRCGKEGDGLFASEENFKKFIQDFHEIRVRVDTPAGVQEINLLCDACYQKYSEMLQKFFDKPEGQGIKDQEIQEKGFNIKNAWLKGYW